MVSRWTTSWLLTATFSTMTRNVYSTIQAPSLAFWMRESPIKMGKAHLSLSRFLSGMMRLSHHHTVTGGTTHGRCTVHRATVPPDGVPGFHQPDARRVSAARPALRDRVPNPYGGMADGWETADRTPVCRLQKLPSADTRRPPLVHRGLPENLRTPGGARALIRYGSGQSESVDPRPGAGVARGAARPWQCPRPLPLGPGPAPRRFGG